MIIQHLYKKSLTNDVGAQNIGQLAQAYNNIEYFQRSLKFYENYISTIAMTKINSYQFSSLATFNQLKYNIYIYRNDYEEAIAKEVEKNLDKFLNLLEGIDWATHSIPQGHHEYIEDMIDWLKNNMSNIELLNKNLAIETYLNGIQYLAYKMLEFIAKSPSIKRVTQPALYQVWLDLKFIEEHLAMVTNISRSDIKTSMRGLYQTLMLLLMDDPMEYLNEEKRMEKYIAVKGIQVLKICEKFKVKYK